MGVSSYFEFVGTFFGWIMYQNLWDVLAGSGIVYIPFITIVLTHIIAAKKGGDDEGSAAIQSLKRIEVDIVVTIVVVFLAAVPSVDVTLSEMNFARPALDCQSTATTIQGDATGTTYNTVLTSLGGESAQAPVWWAAIHTATKSVVSASIAGIPCAHDLENVELALANNAIKDPQLVKEIQDFINDCYKASKSKLLRTSSATLTDDQRDETQWLGSNYFRTTAGYYDTYYSRKANSNWTYIASRDAGFESDISKGGHPGCNEWWSNGSSGLRARSLDTISPTLMDNLITGTNSVIAWLGGDSLSATEKQDVVLRKYLSIKTGSNTFKNFSTSYTPSSNERVQKAVNEKNWLGGLSAGANSFLDTTTTAIAAVGGVVSVPGALGEGKLIREGVSMIQVIVLMLFIISLPLLLVMSEYKLSTLMTLTIIYFAINFISYIWAVAFWVDNNLIRVILSGAGELGPLSPSVNVTQMGMLVWIQRFLYLALPVMFLTMMGWAGVNAGHLGRSMEGLGNNASAPGKAGGSVVTSVVTKGKG